MVCAAIAILLSQRTSFLVYCVVSVMELKLAVRRTTLLTTYTGCESGIVQVFSILLVDEPRTRPTPRVTTGYPTSIGGLAPGRRDLIVAGTPLTLADHSGCNPLRLVGILESHEKLAV